MNVFELLFYFCLLASTVILSSIVTVAVRGRFRDAWMTFRVYAVFAILYMVVLLATKFTLPVGFVAINVPQFSGDWSITVEGIRRYPHDHEEYFEVDFSVANLGTRAYQEKGLIVYLSDENETRYDPGSDPSSPPFDVLLKPGQKVSTMRKFDVPPNLQRLNLFVVREGLHLGWFVIGRAPFDSRTAVHIL